MVERSSAEPDADTPLVSHPPKAPVTQSKGFTSTAAARRGRGRFALQTEAAIEMIER